MSARPRPEAPRASWWDRLWQPFWAVPATIAGISLVLGIGLPEVDKSLGSPFPWIFEGGTAGARSVLGTISGAMISVTGLVFSITMVILQLASSQFTPRILGTFLHSRITQVTLGVFTGSFLYSLSVLRTIRAGEDVAVPQTAVALAYLYVVVAVALFLAFIHHITRSVQVSHVITDVSARTLASISRLADDQPPPTRWSPKPGTPRCALVMDEDRGGYVTVIASTALVRCAAELRVVAALDVALGDFVAPGQPVGHAWGREDLTTSEVADLVSGVRLSTERSSRDDVGFGVRQLLDIAERALSPGINDPTTALQALNQIHVVLRDLARRPDPTAYLLDEEDEVRATYRPQRYADLLQMAVTELAHYGEDSVRILPALRSMLADLAECALAVHRPVTVEALASA